MKTVTLFALALLLTLSACKKDGILRSVAGSYIVSGTKFDSNSGITSSIQGQTLKISKTIRSSIRIKLESLNEDYVYHSEGAEYYTFASSAYMDCPVGEDIISIGKSNDSIHAFFYTEGRSVSVDGIKVND
jgi:hypothetical protein